MVRLSEVCNINMGQSPSSDTYNGDHIGLPFFQGNADFGEINPRQRVWCSNPVKIAQTGDILISVRAPIGALNIADTDCCIGRGLAALTVKSKRCLTKYLWYVLQFKAVELIAKGTGSTFKAINKQTLADLEFSLPDIEIQRKIVDKIDNIVALVSRRRKQIKKLDDLVKSQFIEMFGDPAKDEKAWRKATLKDVAKGKLSYGSGASAVDYDGITRYVRITDITDSGELSDDPKSPSVVDEKYLLHDGDILFARSGATVGKTFLYRSNEGRGIYAGYLIRFIPNQDMVLPQYVFNYTKTDYYASFVRDCQRAVAQPNINAQEYGNLMICVPPIELQEQFARFVEQIDKSKIPFEMEVAA